MTIIGYHIWDFKQQNYEAETKNGSNEYVYIHTYMHIYYIYHIQTHICNIYAHTYVYSSYI